MFQFSDDPVLEKIRLNRGDADLVEVIHSNAGDLHVQQFLQIIKSW